MNAIKKQIAKMLGRVDFDIIEIDLSLDKPHEDISSQDISKDNDIVSGNFITAEGVRAWLKTLPEPTFEELQDYLWHDHK